MPGEKKTSEKLFSSFTSGFQVTCLVKPYYFGGWNLRAETERFCYNNMPIHVLGHAYCTPRLPFIFLCGFYLYIVYIALCESALFKLPQTFWKQKVYKSLITSAF